MHGNTIFEQRYKTRPFDRYVGVKSFLHPRAENPPVACTWNDRANTSPNHGGASRITDEDLNDRYHTACDPRLNASSHRHAFLIAELLKQERGGKVAAMRSRRALIAAFGGYINTRNGSLRYPFGAAVEKSWRRWRSAAIGVLVGGPRMPCPS